MRLLDKMEKRFGYLAVPNVVMILIVAQLFIYAMVLMGRVDYGALPLIPEAVLKGGEWWRLLSFLFAPPTVATTPFQALFLAFFWYLLWMMSSALESVWGVFRFNVFLLSGILFTVAGAFLGYWVSPGGGVVVSPQFLYLSVFFAFATLHPNVEFLLMFVLPVKVKWLAWLAAGLTAFAFVFAPSMGLRIVLLAPLLNYFLFFKDAMAHSVQAKARRSQFDKAKRARADAAFHTCERCGADDKTHPELTFRYKTEAGGEVICLCEACRAAEPDVIA